METSVFVGRKSKTPNSLFALTIRSLHKKKHPEKDAFFIYMDIKS